MYCMARAMPCGDCVVLGVAHDLAGWNGCAVSRVAARARTGAGMGGPSPACMTGLHMRTMRNRHGCLPPAPPGNQTGPPPHTVCRDNTTALDQSVASLGHASAVLLAVLAAVLTCLDPHLASPRIHLQRLFPGSCM